MKPFLLAQELQVPVELAAWALEEWPVPQHARERLRVTLERRRAAHGAAVRKVWTRYAAEAAEATDIEGTLALLKDFGLDPEDPHVLALVYELQAPEVGVFGRDKFVDMWAWREVETLPKMAEAARGFGTRMDVDEEYFGHVYNYCFRYNLEPGKKLLELQTALAYWQLLLAPRFALAAQWIQFMSATHHKISTDLWAMALRFMQYARENPTLEGYDDDGAWPLAIDDFVDDLKGHPNVEAEGHL